MIKNKNICIAIYRTIGVGDVVLSFKGLQLLSKQHVDIYYIGYGSALEFVKYFFPEITVIDIGKNNLIKSYQIIDQALPHLDGFIDLQKNSRSALLRLLLRVKYRMHVFKWNKRSIQKRMIVFLNKISGRNHQFSVVTNFRQAFVEELITACFSKCVTYFFNNKAVKPVLQEEYINRSTDGSGKKLVIVPGGSHSVKHAPVDLITSILHELNRKGAIKKVSILGGGNDDMLCKQIQENLPDGILTENISGKINISQIMKLLKQSDAMLATDSAISHLGAYINIPVVVLLGPTIEGFGYANNKGKTKIFSAHILCRPCSRHGHIACVYNDKLCFKNINFKEAADYLTNVLTD